jgi:iron-sulfur cluster assembly accessory protein
LKVMQKMAPIVQFTPNAKIKLVEVLKEQNAVSSFLRIACSGGFRYSMSLEEKPRTEDVVEEVDNIKVVTDKNYADLLRGSQIDYMETLQRRGFKLENPNVVAEGCGCGGH